MSRVYPLLTGLFLGLVVLSSQAAELIAKVDRTRLNSGETVELTLETSDVTLFGKPDLSALDANFDVRGTRQINRLTTLDGGNQATTRWIITLLPRQSGIVVIPSLQLGELKSQPVSLQVMQSDTQDKGSQLAPVFIETSLDQESVYVQAQAVLTLRIYHSVSLFDDSSLSPLQIAEARVDKLGDSRTYEKLINGVRHGVIETRYAIYPQQSGTLEVPALVFSATLVQTGSQNQEASPFGPQPGRLMRVSSAKVPLNVKPKPADYPADVPWLPARSVTLEESWNPEPGNSQVGDSLTRTIILKAEGLSGSQLPPLPATQVAGLRHYPDQPQLGNLVSERGLIGTREEREALVPNRPGAIDLPTVDVTWWNTREDHLEHSSLPARTLQINNNPGLAVDTPVNNEQGGLTVLGPPVWPWQLSTLLLALTTLLSLILWWRARGQPAVTRAVQTGPSPRTVLDDLKRACTANDPHATRQALDAWARQQPETLADMAARFVPLSDALDGLNGALYSETGKFWMGEDLWRAIRTLPAAERIQDPTGDAGLPPLYPK
ncbi:BatD family protein [Pseudomonas cichorii]|uniref:BatD family protein n=1 Tax=Pseudomonas lijiangensis TaxID=2995658 RepID=A0ABX8HVI5_9PSED|nr:MULTISPECIES: BatD family protein [Pseudomonas syringae group]MBX8500427.1 BatD family protein [Pseudomonas lijiangensis]MBX8505114.1 BatD family protein [Pseudomonas lijiangensis]MBX8511769.1 BatD family protein [Pseudomonas cichorii]MBX8525408.1 BatD family protein [Pseudomonas cichorii]MBX8597666.1 BatD family protein [Pseudomonas cichorii]